MFYAKSWHTIPDGSTFEVDLDPRDASSITGYHSLARPGAPALVGSITSNHFPLRIQIRKGEQHKVSFDAAFDGANASMTLEVKVTTPAGAPYGNPPPIPVVLGKHDPVFTAKLYANGEA